MTPQEIIAAIKADPALTQLAMDGRDGDIARAIAPEQKPKSFRLTSDAVLKSFNRNGSHNAGGSLMKRIRTLATADNPVGHNAAEIVRLMDGNGWELMDNATPAILADWKAANVVNDAQINAIRALAMEGVRPSVDEISKALKPFRPDGKVGQLVGF